MAGSEYAHERTVWAAMDFFDEAHEQMVDEPRFVDRGKVTADTFANAGARVLESTLKPACIPCM